MLRCGGVIRTGVNLYEGIQHYKFITTACFRKCAFCCAVLYVDSVVKYLVTTCSLDINGSLISSISGVNKCTASYIYCRNIFTVLAIKMQELSIVCKCTVSIGNSTLTIHPHVIVSTMHKLAVGEVHIAVAKELTIQFATFHIDGARVLKAIVILITRDIESDILERNTISERGNITFIHTCVIKCHTSNITLYSNVL